MITGASRGLGREFTRQFLAEGWRILATCRDPSAAGELNDLAADANGQVAVFQLDVDDGTSVAACREAIGDVEIDVLLNNAGVIGARDAGLGNMDYDSFENTLRTNVTGPMRVTEAFIDCLLAGEQKKLVTISSRMGSIAETAPNAMIYRTSKAAVNMVVKCLALELASKGVIAAVLHPGWVQTDMGGPSAALTVEESVSNLRRVINGLSQDDNGSFLNYDGSPIPW